VYIDPSTSPGLLPVAGVVVIVIVFLVRLARLKVRLQIG
jgi:hypothetical protein